MAGTVCCQVSNVDYGLHHEIISYFAKSVSPVFIRLQTRTGRSISFVWNAAHNSKLRLKFSAMGFEINMKVL